jgi:hypothetical protein
MGTIVVLVFCLHPGQEIVSQAPVAPPQNNINAAANGVEVMARGPVHEAFAAPAAEPAESPVHAKKPPAPIDEMPPEEKPEGDAVWIGGYWAWDDDRGDYLWVSGCWRVKPPGKEWVPGYWREKGTDWQWVAGFWANAQPQGNQAGTQVPAGAQPAQSAGAVTYYPQPPAAPAVAPPPPSLAPDQFYVPGGWVWIDGRYIWRAGYYMTGRPGYVWVPASYRWTPYGYVFVPGYWDMAIPNRGVLYAPVVINFGLVGPSFVYAPCYAIRDTIVLDALFIRPAYCHYYFGNYYGPRYVGLGFESCYVYGRRHYDSIVVYQTWAHRSDPGWLNVQVNLSLARSAGRAPIPGRTVIVAPAREVVVARGQRVVALSPAARSHALEVARVEHRAAVEQRRAVEVNHAPGRALTQPHAVSLNVPHSPPAAAGTRPGTSPAAGTHPTPPGAAAAGMHPGTSPPANGAHPMQPGAAAAGMRPGTSPATPGAPPMPPGSAAPSHTPPPGAAGHVAPQKRLPVPIRQPQKKEPPSKHEKR